MDKKRIIQPVIFAVIVYIIWEISGNITAYILPAVLNRLNFKLPGDYWYMFLSEMSVWLLFCIIFWKYIKIKDIFCNEGILKYVWVLLPVILQILDDVCTLFAGNIVIKLLSLKGFTFVVSCFAGTMSIGLLEETVWRKVIFGNAIRKWGSTKRGIIFAVIFQALLFGLCHYMNMLSAGQDFYDTSKQVLSSVCMGIFLSGVYYRTGKFMVPVIIHGLCNFSNFFMNEMLGWDYDILKWSSTLQVIISLLYLFSGIYMAAGGKDYKNTKDSGGL